MPSTAARSLSLRSFFSFRFAFSLSLSLSEGVDPFGFVGNGLALPVVGCSTTVVVVTEDGGGVDVVDLLARCGGRGRSGTGVGPFVGGWVLLWAGGSAETLELGVAETVAVRRYA